MFRCHVVFVYNGFSLCRSLSYMSSHTASVEEDFNGRGSQTDIHLFTDQIKWDGIFVTSVRNQIVCTDFDIRIPCCKFISLCRKRLHKCFFFLQIRTAPTSFSLPEFSEIEFLQFHTNGFFGFVQRKEVFITQCRKNPCGCKFHTAFRKALILRMFHTCRNNGGIIILSHFLITAVQYSLISVVLGHTGLEVVRNQEPCHTTEVFVSVYMAVQPGLQWLPHRCNSCTAERR